ncbi:MAG: hypothetical protein JXA25_07215 [Anaerolineales bacterium]|nr:hypothetical protein [Anaerolineales bacterium]
MDLQKLLTDGAILSGLASLFIVISLRLYPRIWLHDYPADIQAAVPSKTPQEKKLSLLWGIPFMLLLLAVPLFSTLTLEQQAGGTIPFWTLFLHAFGIVLIFNLFDWLILDWLMFCTITPEFLVIPGSEGMSGYKDYWFHFRGFLFGTLFSAFGGLIIAVVVYFLSNW